MKIHVRTGCLGFVSAAAVVAALAFVAADWWFHGGAVSDSPASTGALALETTASPAPGDRRDPLLFVALQAKPQGSGGDACSLGETAALWFGRWTEGRDAPDSDLRETEAAPTCRYIGRLVGRGPECLVEFPGTLDQDIATTPGGQGFAARLALRYYRRRLPGVGLLYPQAKSAENPRVFLMLDDRWCRWFGAEEGFRLVPVETATLSEDR